MQRDYIADKGMWLISKVTKRKPNYVMVAILMRLLMIATACSLFARAIG